MTVMQYERAVGPILEIGRAGSPIHCRTAAPGIWFTPEE